MTTQDRIDKIEDILEIADMMESHMDIDMILVQLLEVCKNQQAELDTPQNMMINEHSLSSYTFITWDTETNTDQ